MAAEMAKYRCPCFEHVLHGLLLELGWELGYPLVLLRLSLSSYCWKRLLVWDHDMVSHGLYPTRGILAGSSFAVFELGLYVIQRVRRHVESVPHSFSIHIDDLHQSVVADTVADTVAVSLWVYKCVNSQVHVYVRFDN